MRQTTQPVTQKSNLLVNSALLESTLIKQKTTTMELSLILNAQYDFVNPIILYGRANPYRITQIEQLLKVDLHRRMVPIPKTKNHETVPTSLRSLLRDTPLCQFCRVIGAEKAQADRARKEYLAHPMLIQRLREVKRLIDLGRELDDLILEPGPGQVLHPVSQLPMCAEEVQDLREKQKVILRDDSPPSIMSASEAFRLAQRPLSGAVFNGIIEKINEHIGKAVDNRKLQACRIPVDQTAFPPPFLLQQLITTYADKQYQVDGSVEGGKIFLSLSWDVNSPL